MQSVGRQRPLGVSIIAIVLLVLGILGILGAIFGLIALTAVHSTVIDAAIIVSLIIGLIIAIAEIVLFRGLWTLKPWAFWATVVVVAINVVLGLYSLLVAHNSTGLVDLILGLVVLIYLFADHNVRAAFRT